MFITATANRRSRQGIVLLLMVLVVMLMQVPLALAAEPYKWQQAVIKGGGYVTGLYYHPKNADIVYMRTDMGGAYRLDTAANRWIPLLDWVGFDDYMALHGICSIALDPTDDKKVYLFTGMYLAKWGSDAAILRSNDRGATWARTNLPFKGDGNSAGRWCADRLKVDPNYPSILLLGTPGGLLYKSTDSAVTWKQVTSFPAIANNKYGLVDIEFAGGSAGKPTQTIYAGVNRNGGGATLWKSTDGGNQWAEVKGGPDSTPSRYLNKVVQNREGNLLLVYSNSSETNMGEANPKQGWLYRLDPSTDTWTILRVTKGYGIGAVAADPQNANVLMITSLAKWSGTFDIWRSEDGGANWKAMTIKRSGEPPYITVGWPYPHWSTDIDISPRDSNQAMISGVAGVYRCPNATSPTQTWVFYNDGMEQTCINALACPPTGKAKVFSTTFDISGFRHDDLGVSPIKFKPDMDGSLDIDFAQNRPERLVRTATKKPFGAYSDDAGETWKPFVTPTGVSGGGATAISADGERILWAPAGISGLYGSSDKGVTWTGCSGIAKVALLAADGVDADSFYAYGRDKGEFYRSVDKGKSFAMVATGLNPKARKLIINRETKGDLWLGGENGLFHSTDAGTTWVAVGSVGKVVAIGLGKARDAKGYPAIYLVGMAGGEKGIFRSDDTGATWKLISDPAHQFGLVQAITGDPRNFGRVYLGTNGRGLFYGDPQ